MLLPVYNGAGTLRQALDSILAQDLADFELLVVDDASTDASAAIIREYAERDDRIAAVLHARNVGLAETLNEGLRSHAMSSSRGWTRMTRRSRRGYESQQASSWQSIRESSPPGATSSSWAALQARPARRTSLRRRSEIAGVLPRENCLYHPSVMLRRTEVLEAGGYRGEFKNAEDYELWLRLARVHDLANVPQALLRYRFSLGGMTLSRKWEQLFYVHLALEMNRDSKVSIGVARRRAREATEAVDRRSFMTQVARGTAMELSRLGLAPEALRLISRFAQEIGPVTASRVATFVIAEQLRSATRRVQRLPEQVRPRHGMVHAARVTGRAGSAASPSHATGRCSWTRSLEVWRVDSWSLSAARRRLPHVGA